MSETLMDKAVCNYNVAYMIHESSSGDELYLNYIGYHLQQSVELALKYQLDVNGVDYPKTHDIDQLIRIAHETDTELAITPYVESHSEMFTLWESRTRYVLNYHLESSKVETALSEVRNFLEYVAQYEIKTNAEDEDEESR